MTLIDGATRLPLSDTQETVSAVVRDMELAFATGSYSRVLTSMTSHIPYASNVEHLRSMMFTQPALGWSCWEMSVLLVQLLKERGIDSGVTIAFGAEEGAQATPHSLVRVIEENGTIFYADPYFGIGALGLATTLNDTYVRRGPLSDAAKWWNSPTVHGHISVPTRHERAFIITISHRAHPRDFRYHVLPGVLTPEQLDGALWQAELFGAVRLNLRFVNHEYVALLRKDISEDEKSVSLRWNFADVIPQTIVTTGSWYEITTIARNDGEKSRNEALKRLAQP